MTRLQIGFSGRYVGRGFWRRVFGSGPFRVTPIDVAIADKDAESVAAAAEVLTNFVRPSDVQYRIGSLFSLEGVLPFFTVKGE